MIKSCNWHNLELLFLRATVNQSGTSWTLYVRFTLTQQFTGWKDPALTELGEAEALKGAEELKKAGYVRMIHFDGANMMRKCMPDHCTD